MVGALLAVPLQGLRADAACDAIPSARRTFRSATASVDRPFAGPGEWIAIAHDAECDGDARFADAVEDHVATFAFVPPGGGPASVVVVAASEPTSALADAVAACGGSLVVDRSSFHRRTDDQQARTLEVRFPDTDALVRDLDDDLTLTGPVRIALSTPAAVTLPCLLAGSSCADLTARAGLLGCVDRLSAGGACGRDEDALFASFTALPPPNDYRAMSAGTQDVMRAAIDAAGNLLLPFDWRGILFDRSAVPVARMLRGSAAVEAFPGTGRWIKITAEKQSVLSAHDVRGVRLPPIFEPHTAADDQGTTLFGTADAPSTVLRIARRNGACDDGAFCTSDADCASGACRDACADDPGASCGSDPTCPVPCGQLFDFATRQVDGVGPVTIDVSDRVEALDPVPLDGLLESAHSNAFVVEEPFADVDLNGDGDALDHVILLAGRADGATIAIGAGPNPACGQGGEVGPPVDRPRGRAVARIAQPPFSFPAAVLTDDVLAFLEPEPLQYGVDQTCNGSAFETVLRAYSVAGRDLTEGQDLAADAAPVIDGRSLAVSGGKVFFRSDQRASARSSVRRLTASASRFDYGAITAHPDVSADGRYVVFAANEQGNSWQSLHVYRHDRCVSGGLPVPRCEPGTRRISDQGQSFAPRISGNGRDVVFVRRVAHPPEERPPWSGPLVDDVLLYDTVLDATETISISVSGGLGNGQSTNPTITDDGRYVAFESEATNLVDGDTNENRDVFVRDRCVANGIPIAACSPSTRRVSVSSSGVQANSYSWAATIAPLGNVVVFRSIASNLVDQDEGAIDFFVHDLASAATTRIGLQYSDLGLFSEFQLYRSSALSADGRFIAFDSGATAVPGDTNGVHDVFVYDREANTFERASVDANGAQLAGPSEDPSISRDGRFVGFVNRRLPAGALRVLLHDRVTGMTKVIASGGQCGSDDGYFFGGYASADADVLAFEARRTDGARDTCMVAIDPLPAGTTSTAPVLTVLGADAPITTLGAAQAASVASGRAAFLTPATDGGAPFVELWPGSGTAVDTGVRARSIALSDRWLAALVATPGAEIASGRAQALGVAQFLDVRHGGGWRDSGQLATRVDVSGELAAMLSPDPSAAGAEPGAAGEPSATVLRIVDPGAPGVDLIDPRAAHDFVLGGPRTDPGRELVAFRAPELAAASAVPGGDCVTASALDLNGDRDACDDVLQVYDAEDGHVINTGQAVTPCLLEACDPRLPYRVLDDTVRFLTFERDQGKDLNGDRDQDDLVVQVFNVREACRKGDARVARHTLAAAAAGVCTDTGRACADDRGCGPGASCFVPPGGCTVTLEAGCDPTTEGGENGSTCGPDAYCQPLGEHEGSCRALRGTCRGGPDAGAPCTLGTPCAGDAECSAHCRGQLDCSADAVCVESGQRFVRLSDPLKPDSAQAGAAVFASAGRCIERTVRCSTSEDCPRRSFCDGGFCERDHGACASDGRCTGNATCRQDLVVQTALDTDRDELPDVIDNCPGVANVAQDDVDDDGIGDACDLANALCPRGTAIERTHVTVAPRHDGGSEIHVRGRIAVAEGTDPLAAVLASGMEIALEDLSAAAPRSLLELSRHTGVVPPLGASCGPQDGWRSARSGNRIVYTNLSGAIGTGCVAGSARGLSRIVLVRRGKDPSIDFTLRARVPAAAATSGPLRLTLALGAEGTSGASCATRDLGVAACSSRGDRARLVCAGRR